MHAMDAGAMPGGRRIVVRRARLFDSPAGVFRDGSTIVVEGDRVVAATQEPIEVDDAAVEIDAAGRAVLPGLIDAHVHVAATSHDLIGLTLKPPSLVTAESAAVMPDEGEQFATPRRRRGKYHAHYRSSHNVTGPSFTRSTSIIAPNSPVSTGVPPARSNVMNRSYNGMACSGRAASMNDGRRPFDASPYNVNCDTTSTDPPTSPSARFIFPSASVKRRIPATFSAIQSTWASPSVVVKPTSATNPRSIRPMTFPSTRTSARLTR
jgi:hypothetical protein